MEEVVPFVSLVDMVLVMTIQPGFGTEVHARHDVKGKRMVCPLKRRVTPPPSPPNSSPTIRRGFGDVK